MEIWSSVGRIILQVYNLGRVKDKLQTSGLYIATTKPGGFNIDITNYDTNTVMVAISVLLGRSPCSGQGGLSSVLQERRAFSARTRSLSTLELLRVQEVSI